MDSVVSVAINSFFSNIFITMKFYSQIQQDEIYIKYISGKKYGYFVDIGANDGTTFSNTKTLEESLEWKGLLIEANPVAFAKCATSRLQPSVWKAVYNKKSVLPFRSPDDTLIGGLNRHLCSKQELAYTNQGQVYSTFDVPADTLINILKENNAPKTIDYCSIDTEGSEFEILECFIKENKALPKEERYFIKYLDIEHNYIKHNQDKIIALLKANGYQLRAWNNFDFTFVHL